MPFPKSFFGNVNHPNITQFTGLNFFCPLEFDNCIKPDSGGDLVQNNRSKGTLQI
jgi:hypothetical protein